MNGLQRHGLENIHTLEDVQYFKKNYTQLVDDIINNVKIWLSNDIISLKNKQAQLIEELKEKITLRKTDLLNEMEQRIERIERESLSK